MNQPKSASHADLYADINGAKLCYQIAGQGHTLVLIHAGIADKRIWDHQFDVFAERFRVIRYDQRGFGKSSMPDDTFSYMDDLRELLDLLGVESAYMISVSRWVVRWRLISRWPILHG